MGERRARTTSRSAPNPSPVFKERRGVHQSLVQAAKTKENQAGRNMRCVGVDGPLQPGPSSIRTRASKQFCASRNIRLQHNARANNGTSEEQELQAGP